MSKKLAMQSPPEMMFGDNVVELHHLSSGFRLTFRAEDALRNCSKPISATSNDTKETNDPANRASSASPEVRVVAAERWTRKMVAHPDAKKINFSYDWTFTTDYKGTADSQAALAEPTTEEIDLELLKVFRFALVYVLCEPYPQARRQPAANPITYISEP